MSIFPGWWRRRFLVWEGLLTLVVTAGFAWWSLGAGGAGLVNDLLKGNRAAVYGTAASVFGSLLGFIITSASIVFAVSGSERLQILRDSRQYPTLWAVFSAAIRTCGLATAIAFWALIFDQDVRPISWLQVAFVFCCLLAVLRIIRAIWALENIIFLVTANRQE